jgi:16S rRNA (adenine1518-N6/adenine1519-N6)-dimethyltransferase
MPGRLGSRPEDEDLLARNRAWLMDVLRRHNLRPHKGMGQNFLIDQRVLDLMVAEAEVGPEDTVVEIGAGLGTLTIRLLERAGTVHAAEVDRGYAAFLEEQLGDRPNFRLHRVDGAKLLERLASEEPGTRLKLVANIPYQISSRVMLALWRHAAAIPLAVLMVQDEFARRLAAPMGTRAAGALSALLGLEHSVEKLITVERRLFWPRPGVDSAVIRIRRTRDLGLTGEQRRFLRRVVQALFMKRRKTLRNALLAAGFAEGDGARLHALLEQLDIAPSRRGETLSRDEVLLLAERLAAEEPKQGEPPTTGGEGG